MSFTLERKLTNPKSDLEKEIASFGSWFHNLHLPDGTQTAPNHPLGDFPKFIWQQISSFIPANINGWNVLDIGCNAGYYSFELAKRGAKVLGIDIDSHYLKQANWAKKIFKLDRKTEFKQMKVYELVKIRRKFDIVLFMGVFYHLRHPLLALDIVSTLFNKFMIFQTLTMPGDYEISSDPDMTIDDRYWMVHKGWPQMAFIENALEGDLTNWWAPNHACIEAMIRSCGMEVYLRPAYEVYFCKQKEGFNKILIEQELQAIYSSFQNSNGVDHD